MLLSRAVMSKASENDKLFIKWLMETEQGQLLANSIL